MNETKQINTPVIKQGWFGVKFMYLDANTRVRYGFNLSKVGITYTLQRKQIFWKEVAWTYPSTHPSQNLSEIIEYLKWYEEEEHKDCGCKCLF